MKAQEMFKELGYSYEKVMGGFGYSGIEYTKKELNTGKLTTMLFCDVGDTLLLIDKPYELKPKEINAIHQQMIELGWIQ